MEFPWSITLSSLDNFTNLLFLSNSFSSAFSTLLSSFWASEEFSSPLDFLSKFVIFCSFCFISIFSFVLFNWFFLPFSDNKYVLPSDILLIRFWVSWFGCFISFNLQFRIFLLFTIIELFPYWTILSVSLSFIGWFFNFSSLFSVFIEPFILTVLISSISSLSSELTEDIFLIDFRSSLTFSIGFVSGSFCLKLLIILSIIFWVFLSGCFTLKTVRLILLFLFFTYIEKLSYFVTWSFWDNSIVSLFEIIFSLKSSFLFL
jgi:hypothetical protein